MSKKVIKLVKGVQLLNFIKSNGNACRFVSILYKAPIKKGKGIKTAHPFGEVFKISKFQGLVNTDYVEAIKTRIAATLEVRKSEVEYELGESAYVHVDGMPPCIVVKKSNPNDGVYYLQYRPDVEKAESVYVNAKDEILDKEKVKPWLYAKSAGPAWKPPVNALMLSRIVELRASGKVATVEDADDAKALLALADSEIEISLFDEEAAQESVQHTGGKPQFA